MHNDDKPAKEPAIDGEPAPVRSTPPPERAEKPRKTGLRIRSGVHSGRSDPNTGEWPRRS